MPKLNDEYDWSKYSPEYSAQMKDVEKENDLWIRRMNRDNNGDIVFHDNLHPNWKALYHYVTKLRPTSVFEVGIGCGMHLTNLQKLWPLAEYYGCDISEDQINLATEKYGLPLSISCRVNVMDFAKPLDSVHKFDVVFSQAVVMHQSTENAKAMLKNMGRIAEKNIILIEGVKNHSGWYDMVKECLPEFDSELTTKYIDYGVLLTRK